MLYSVSLGYAGASDNYFQLKGPLFEELLIDEPGISKYIPYWGYNTNEDLFRSYALKFGHRWSLSGQYDEMKQYHLIPMYYPEKCQEYDVPFMLALEPTHPEVPLVLTTGKKKRPWILDPRIEEGFLKDAEERSGVVLSDILGAREDVEAICKDKSGVCVDGGERIY